MATFPSDTMEGLPTVLRLPRVDREASFVLLNVVSAGRRALDVKLIGTDGESVFSLRLKHNQTTSLKDRSFTDDQDKLDGILSTILLGGERDEASRDIEAVARVDNDALTILIQRHVEGITQKLAKVTLPETPEEEIELYEWCGLTVQLKETAFYEVQALKKRLEEKEAVVETLRQELADLVQRKIDNENSMIEKFSLLLNEKKSKIRDQQRVLATATVDPVRLEAVEQSRDAKFRSPKLSRARKRKAVKDESEEESNGGFEKMDADDQNLEDSDEDPPRTPDPESTADEAAEVEEQLPPPPSLKKTVHQAKNQGATSKASSSTSHANTCELPPKRDLPFGKKNALSTPPRAAAAAEGSETESDNDDEL